MASGAWDGSVRLWNAITGKELFYSPGHRGIVSDVTFSASGRLLASASADGTALIWDVERLSPAKPPRTRELTANEIATLWDDLASPDARRAYLAIVALRAGGPRVAADLGKRIKPVEAPLSDEQIARLVRDLASDLLTTRQAADRELERLGSWAELHLRKRLKEQPSLESRRRLESLLDRIEQREKYVSDPKTLQALRALEVLEWLGTPESKQCLMRLREGAPAARLTQEARAALDRQARWPDRPDPSRSSR
jgi:hypothetical protein